jgi:hypothetical protein
VTQLRGTPTRAGVYRLVQAKEARIAGSKAAVVQRDTPRCEHGFWTFAGADFKRHAAKRRCPTGEGSPKSKWVKGSRRNSLIPRETNRWRSLYRGRAAVEREFGRLKNEYGLTPVRVRGIERVALHADLTMLARLKLGSRQSASDTARRLDRRPARSNDRAMGQTLYQWRCFWRWPPGHK